MNATSTSRPTTWSIKRKLLFFLVLPMSLLAVVLVALWPALGTVLVQEGLRQAKSSGLKIAWTGLHVAGSTVTLKSLETWLPGPEISNGYSLPIQIQLDNVSVRVTPLSLFSLDPKGTFSGEAYGGSIAGDAASLSNEPAINVTFKGVDFGQHSQIRSLGIHSAILMGSVRASRLAPLPRGQTTFDLKLSKVHVPSLPQLVSLLVSTEDGGDISSLLKLPPLEDGELDLEGNMESDTFHINSARLTSSIGGLNGWYKRVIPQRGQRGTCEGEFLVSLAEATLPSLGPWLPLITNNALTSQNRNFRIRLTGVECSRPRYAAGEIFVDGMCIRTRFEPTELPVS